MKIRRQTLYALLGAALGFGAPTGLAVVRWLGAGLPAPAFFLAQFRAEPGLYAYVTIGSVAVVAAFGWVLGMQEDSVRALTFVDALTGLGNRRLFDARLAEEVARANRYRTALSLLIIDLDRFKNVNDRFGHVQGDLVLRIISAIVRDGFRSTDVVCRYGGEEIAVIAPSTRAAEARVFADRLREHISETVIPLSGEPYRITVSVGVAQHFPGETVASLIERADIALYGAKEAGRNRTSLAEQQVTLQ